jgi:tRNA (adenine58-N1)-methyltransferase non-catalytic subunit
VFIPLRVNSLNLLDYYTAKNPERIRELRVDTLSQILTHANVRAGSRLLVADDTGGLLGTAICERAGKNSDIYFIHDGKTPALELMKQANITHFHTYPWYRFTEPLVEQEITTDDVVAIERKQTRFAKLVQEDQAIKAGGFDALIIASKFDPLEVLTKLEPFLAYSAQVVCYAPRKEVFLCLNRCFCRRIIILDCRQNMSIPS